MLRRFFPLFKPRWPTPERILLDDEHQGECDLLYWLALLDKTDPLPEPFALPELKRTVRPLPMAKKRFRAHRWPIVDLD